MDPVRLLDGELTASERELLESAQAETPDAATQAILFAGMSLPLSVSGLTAAPSAAPPAAFAGPGAQVVAGVAPAGAKLSLSSVMVWASGIGLVGAVGLGLWGLSSPSRTTQVEPASNAPMSSPALLPRASSANSSPVSPSSQAASNSSAAVSDAAPVAEADPPASSKSGAPPSSSRAAPQPSVASRPLPSLTEEIRALDPARALLAQRKPEQALQVLEGYRSRFPRGTLRPEAEALRAQARELMRASATSPAAR